MVIKTKKEIEERLDFINQEIEEQREYWGGQNTGTPKDIGFLLYERNLLLWVLNKKVSSFCSKPQGAGKWS